MMDDSDGSIISSTDSEDNDLNLDEEKIQTLENKIIANPYDYNAHVELLTYLDFGGDLDRCRDVRERMSVIFPLTPEMWLDWIKKERMLLSINKAQVQETLEKLYNRAVKDYHSVRLWCQYCSDAIHSLDFDTEKIRALFEKGVSEVGLHVSQGLELWDQYRQYEMTLLTIMKEKLEEESDEKELLKTLYSKQEAKVNNIFMRQLSVPLKGMKIVMKEYKEWLGLTGTIHTNTMDKYNKAASKLEKLLEFEEALEATAAPHKEEYQYYIEYERKENNPNRVICLLERAITDNPLDSELWLDYLNYLDQVVKHKSAILLAYKRAVRNIPWVVEVWCQFMLAQQRHQNDFSNIESTLDEALKNGFSDSTSYVTLYATYLDCHWRKDQENPRESNGSSDNNNPNPLNEAFQRSINFIYQQYGEEGDPTAELTRFMAECDGVRADLQSMRLLLDGLIDSKLYKEQSGIWMFYINLEQRFGSKENVRKLYQKAIQCNTDNSEYLFQQFLFFERLYGTIESYDNACLKVKRQRKRIHDKMVKEKSKKEVVNKGDSKKKNNKIESKKRKPSTEAALATPVKVQKTKISSAEQHFSFKKPKSDQISEAGSAPIDKSKYDLTIFVSNVSYDANEDHLNEAFKQVGDIVDIRLVKSVNGKSRGFGYIEFHTREEVMSALELDRISILGRPCYVSECRDKERGTSADFKYGTGIESHKLYVSNLPYKVTESEVRDMFEKVAKVKSIRMVTTKGGKFKGFCYIEYFDEASAKKAVLQLNDTEIHDRKMLVAISNPPKKSSQSVSVSASKLKPSSGLLLPRSVAKAAISLKDTPKKPLSDDKNSEPSAMLSNSDFRKFLKKPS